MKWAAVIAGYLWFSRGCYLPHTEPHPSLIRINEGCTCSFCSRGQAELRRQHERALR